MLFFFQDEFRGKGTTGRPYFDCGHNNAVWVSMDMIVYPPPTAGQHVPCDRNTGKHRGQHKPSSDSTAKQSFGQYTTTGASKSSRQGGIVSSVASRAWNLITGTTEVVGKDQQQYPTSKLYKLGDRVVIYSVKTEQPIKATVRWTGQVQSSKESAMPLTMVAGLETVSCMSVWFTYVCMYMLLHPCVRPLGLVCINLLLHNQGCDNEFISG